MVPDFDYLLPYETSSLELFLVLVGESKFEFNPLIVLLGERMLRLYSEMLDLSDNLLETLVTLLGAGDF
jgi:hypothetical protein